MRISLTRIGVLLVLVVSGCQKTVTIRAVEPGMKNIVGIERLAVLDLAYEADPDAGRNVANMIVAELNQAGAFEVMERSAVKKILDEQRFSTTGIVDAATVSSLGKLLGVDGVVVGEVVAFGAGRKVLGKEASVGINIRLVDVESARVIFSDSVTVNADKSQSGERQEAMLNRVALQAAREFVGKIAPHYVERQKHLLSTGGDAGKPNKRGITFASNGLWDKAQEQFEAAARIDPESAAVQNNLGVCCEQFGRLKDAIDYYERAIMLDPDDEAIQKNLASIRDTFRPPQLSAKELLEKQKQTSTQTAPTKK
jgi:tetratricopeptide (TPR) repeat protein